MYLCTIACDFIVFLGPTAATSSVNAGPNPEVTTILLLSATISPSKSSPTIVGAGAHNEGDGGVPPKKEAVSMLCLIWRQITTLCNSMFWHEGYPRK